MSITEKTWIAIPCNNSKAWKVMTINSDWICTVWGDEKAEGRANLIAAAPELYRALEGLLAYHYHNDIGVKPKEYHNAKAALSSAGGGK